MIAERLPLPQGVVDALRCLEGAESRHFVAMDPHHDGAARNETVLPWCAACSRAHWYPALHCPICGRDGWEWRGFGREGTLDSWTVVCHAVTPALRSSVPFTVGLICPVQAPGVRLVSALIVRPDEPLRIGQPVFAGSGPELGRGRLLVFSTERSP
jgi:uncharacterized protein